MILQPISLYCERSGTELLGEPLNLAACLVFAPVALLIWRLGTGLAVLRAFAVLVFLLFPAGVYLHMLPSLLAVSVNIVTILMIMLLYFFGVNRDLVGLSPKVALACTAMILPFAAVSLPLIALVRGFESSAAYITLPVLIMGYAIVLRPDKAEAARGFFCAALIMVGAIIARTVDLPLCESWPYGTHPLWILGMGWLLWQLAHVYSRQMLAGAGGGR